MKRRVVGFDHNHTTHNPGYRRLAVRGFYQYPALIFFLAVFFEQLCLLTAVKGQNRLPSSPGARAVASSGRSYSFL